MGADGAATGSGAGHPKAIGHAVDRQDTAYARPTSLVRALNVTFEVVLLGYLAGIAAFTREFAHLHLTVHGLPLFAGELTLLVLTLVAVAAHGLRGVLPRALDFASVGLLLILALGAVLAVRGLAAGFGLAALRDFAVVYYGWFFFLTRAYLTRGGTPTRIIGALLAGGLAGSLVTSVCFLTFPALAWGHGTAGHTALYAWVAVIIIILGASGARPLPLQVGAVAALLVCTFVMYISGYRTLLAVVAVTVGLATLLAIRRHRGISRRLVALLWLWAAVMGASIVLPRLMNAQTDRFVGQNGRAPLGDAMATVAFRWTSDLREDATGSLGFRSNAWRQAVRRIVGSPLAGIGFGPQAVLHPESDCDTAPSPTSNCGSAHNTYLTLAMRMGIPSALFICAILASQLVRSARALSEPDHAPAPDLPLAISFLVLVSFLVFGCSSLLFESPYLSSVVWVVAAIPASLGTGATLAWRKG